MNKLKLWMCVLLATPVFAQEQKPSPLRISGYVQPQYVDDESTSSFSVRRGRIRFLYQISKTSRVVVQPDFATSGVTLKDGYVELVEPWTSWKHTLSAGQFKWPFGFEILYSSSQREMPERTLMYRTLFPGERDRGAMLSGLGAGDHFNYRVAVVNGNGTTQSSDTDKRKDVVGRIGGTFGPLTAGVSAYDGSDRGFDKERYAARFGGRERCALVRCFGLVFLRDRQCRSAPSVRRSRR
jgi:hypothetical protein